MGAEVVESDSTAGGRDGAAVRSVSWLSELGVEGGYHMTTRPQACEGGRKDGEGGVIERRSGGGEGRWLAGGWATESVHRAPWSVMRRAGFSDAPCPCPW
eukprot:scaffold2795_cov106-Isochrysis_galbana.AAC.10